MLRTILATIVATLLLQMPQAFAASCGPYEKVTETLAAKYKESRVGIGVSGRGAYMEVWASAEGTYTIMHVVRRPEGDLACAVDVGTRWETLTDKDPGA